MRVESVALNDQLQVATVKMEKLGTKDGTLGTPQTMQQGDEKEDQTRTCCSRFDR